MILFLVFILGLICGIPLTFFLLWGISELNFRANQSDVDRRAQERLRGR